MLRGNRAEADMVRQCHFDDLANLRRCEHWNFRHIYQSVLIGYRRNALSAVTSVHPPAKQCAANIRSMGSLWILGNAIASGHKSAGKSTNSRSSMSITIEKSAASGMRPRWCKSQYSQAVTALTKSRTSPSSMALRARSDSFELPDPSQINALVSSRRAKFAPKSFFGVSALCL